MTALDRAVLMCQFHNNHCGVWRTDACNCAFAVIVSAEEVASEKKTRAPQGENPRCGVARRREKERPLRQKA